MNRLRDIFPNIVTIDHSSVVPSFDEVKRVDHRKREIADLFSEFYHYVTGEVWTDEQRAAFSTVINRMNESERLT
jgi:hypothetical protein